MPERITKERLKPCPFCGEAPTWSVAAFQLGCANSSCGVEPYSKAFSIEAEARTAWNHRPIVSAGHGSLGAWLRTQADKLISNAKSRRSYAESDKNLTPEDLKAAHSIAERMTGRKLPRQNNAQRKEAAEVEKRIASKLETEAAMLNGFADEVDGLESQLLAYRESGALEALKGASAFYTKRQRTLAERAIAKLEAIGE